MKKICILFLISFSVLRVYGQITFRKSYGGSGTEKKCMVVNTSDGGYAMAGTTQSYGAGGNDIYLLRMDQYGNLLWTKTYGGSGSDQAYSIRQTNDDGFIISGATTSFGNNYNDVYMIRTDANGDTLWTQAFGGNLDDDAWGVLQTTDNGFLAAGDYGSTGKNYLVKTNVDGDTLWTRIYDTGKAFCVIQTADGGYTVTGSVFSISLGGQDLFLYHTNALGAVIWYKVYGGSGTEYGYDIKQTADGGYVVIGHTSSFGSVGNDIYVVKTDENGQLVWSKTYGMNSYDQGYGILITNDGYQLLGSTSTNGNTWTGMLININNTGDVSWAKNYTSGMAGSIQSTMDGGYIFSSNINDCFLTKTDSAGNSGCNFTISSIIESVPVTQTDSVVPILSYGTSVRNPNTIVSSGGTTTTLCISTGIEDPKVGPQSLIISPNPCYNCELKGGNNFEDLTISDVQGKSIPVLLTKSMQGSMMSMPESFRGMFIVRDLKSGQVVKGIRMH